LFAFVPAEPKSPPDCGWDAAGFAPKRELDCGCCVEPKSPPLLWGWVVAGFWVALFPLELLVSSCVEHVHVYIQ
jgi:hypothetical protein